MKVAGTEIDLSSAQAIREEFARRAPAPPPPMPEEGFPDDPSPEEMEKIESFARFVRAAIPEVLGRERAPRPRAFSSWSPEQRVFLEEIAKVPEESHLDAGTLSDMLRARGALDVGSPDDDRFLRRYVGLATPTILEVEVGGRPHWLSLRLRLMGELDDGAWNESVSALTASEPVELAWRATDNAYQLMRRWPLPRDLTPEHEHHDATQLYDVLSPLLESLSAAQREAAITKELTSARPNGTLVLLLSIGQAGRGEPLVADDESLRSALMLFTSATVGRRFLTLLSEERRCALIEGMELTPHNLRGWDYLDLLSAFDRQRVLLRAFESFPRAVKPGIATRVAQHVRSFDDAGRTELRALIARGGPNAKMLTAALEG
jgi:hypothetical protein